MKHYTVIIYKNNIFNNSSSSSKNSKDNSYNIDSLFNKESLFYSSFSKDTLLNKNTEQISSEDVKNKKETVKNKKYCPLTI